MPTALITGANRGLGFETSRALIAEGFDVWVAARREDAAQEAAQRLGPKAHPVALDVTSESDAARVARDLDQPLDVLVNNAGVSFNGFDAGVVEKTLAANYHGAVRTTRALEVCLTQSAVVVNVSSGMGELSAVGSSLQRALLEPKLDQAGLDALVRDFSERVERDVNRLGEWPRSAYRVSKIALNTWTRILAREWAGSARHVHVVCPGWVRTDMGGPSASRSVEKGASGIVWAALGADGSSGHFFRDGRRIDW